MRLILSISLLVLLSGCTHTAQRMSLDGQHQEECVEVLPVPILSLLVAGIFNTKAWIPVSCRVVR
jgi:hypothetical protein